MADFDPVSYMMGQKAAGGGGGGSSTLAGLTDVDISNPSDGQTLVYNATAQKWENGAGGGGVLVVNEDGVSAQLDKTWQEIADAMTAGKPVFISTPMVDGSSMGLVVATGIDQGDYLLYVINLFAPGVEQTMKYNANSSSDYPVGPD